MKFGKKETTLTTKKMGGGQFILKTNKYTIQEIIKTERRTANGNDIMKMAN